MDKYEDLIEQYVEKFDEGFPTFMAPGEEEEHMEIIKNLANYDELFKDW